MTIMPAHRMEQKDGARTLKVELQELESLQGVDLDISPTEVLLKLPGASELRIPLPKPMHGEAKAKFSKKQRQLTITWPEPAEVEGVDCIDLLSQEIEHALKQCNVEKLQKLPQLSGGSILLDSFGISGEATATRAECQYKVSISFDWAALDAVGGQLATGGCFIADLTPHAAPQVAVEGDAGPPHAEAAKKWMRKEGALLIAAALDGPALCAALTAAASAAAKPLLKAEVNEWARSWLGTKLPQLSVRLFGGTAVVLSEPIVSGEVPCITLDCSWRASMPGKDVEGSLTATFDGTRPTVEASGPPGQVLTAFRQKGVEAVKDLLLRFGEELKRR
ncbi:unnamed protein product [Effrenium voratum]|nr:unnamed protein product [Effrenium voratum]